MAELDRNSIEALLEKDRQALLVGNYDALTLTEKSVDHILRAIERGDLSRSDATRIVTVAQDNAQLLQAAISGIHSAQERIKAIDAVRDGLSLYTDQGERRTIKSTGRDLEKKA